MSNYFDDVEAKIDSLTDKKTSRKAVLNYLSSNAANKEQREAVNKLWEAKDHESAVRCIGQLKRAFCMKHGLDGWPVKP